MATQRGLNGRVAAITGGARGIGRATAAAFAARGLRVAIGDLDLAEAERTAAALTGDVIALPLNVTDRASVDAFVDETEARLGPLEVFVNNAGIMQLGTFATEDDATTQRQIDINVNGVLYGMKAVLPRFLARRTGHVVNVASSAGKGGFPGGATYCGTKHFVVGVSEAVRAEVRDQGVLVSCVMPGVVDTELATGLNQARGIKVVQPDDVAEAIVEALETGRFDVFVPKSIGPISQVMGLLPRGGRDRITKALKADQVLALADPVARRDYELRAARSEPGLAAGDDQRQLTP
jgi:NADP-dependent 3-hydroxy acid dehydrogenase YdfG